MKAHELTLGRSWLIRLDTDGPLYGQIFDAAVSLGVRAATLTVFGAVQTASLRVYHQTSKVYEDYRIERELEIVGGHGNISMRDGAPFLHCHVALSDATGEAFGGHLHETDPTPVFAAEVWLQELLGDPPVRMFDERCGLALWR